MQDDSAESAPPVSDARSAPPGPVPSNVYALLQQCAEELGPDHRLTPQILEVLNRHLDRSELVRRRSHSVIWIMDKIERDLGPMSSGQMAEALMKRGVASPSGRRAWTADMVRQLRSRAKNQS